MRMLKGGGNGLESGDKTGGDRGREYCSPQISKPHSTYERQYTFEDC